MKDTTKTRLRSAGRKTRKAAGAILEGLAEATRQDTTIVYVETTSPLQRLLNDLTEYYQPAPQPTLSNPIDDLLSGRTHVRTTGYIMCQVIPADPMKPTRKLRVRYTRPELNFEWARIWRETAKTAYHTLAMTGPARIVMSSDTMTKVFKTSTGDFFTEV